MSTPPIPLSPEDQAILGLESQYVAGHTCKVILLGEGAPDSSAVRELVAGRIGAAPELTMKLGGSSDNPAWVSDESFDIAMHVRGGNRESADQAELLDQVTELFQGRLDRDRPLWSMDVLPRPEGRGTVVVWRIHHALADGTAAMRFADLVLWDESVGGAAGAAAPVAGRAASREGTHSHSEHPDHERRRAHLASFIDREFGGSVHRSPFDGPIGGERRIAIAVAPLKALHDAAKAHDAATLNDAVLSLVAGSLAGWLRSHHHAIGSLRVRIPVSLHEEGDQAANRDSFFAVDLPLRSRDPFERLGTIHAETSKRKREHDAERLDRTLRGIEGRSPRLAHLIERIEESPRQFALNISNVRGPKGPVAVLGTPVEGLHTIAEIGLRHGLRVSVISFADNLYFGFCADPFLVPDVEQLATGVEREAAALTG